MFQYGRTKIGVIGIELEYTPELVSAGATAGLAFLPAVQTIRTESAKLRQRGIEIQVVLIHEGSALGTNPSTAMLPWRGTGRS